MELARNLFPQPDLGDRRPDRRRIRQLAVVHLMLFCVSLPGLWLIVKGGLPLALLPQRSGSETLTLAFFLLFFLYLLSLALRGAWGALRLTVFVLRDRRRAA